MKKSFFFLVYFGVFPLLANAGLCDKYWFHIGGVSRHIEVYEPTEYTRYVRQSHPGLGFECETKFYTLSTGEFTNSLDRPMTYSSVTKPLFSYKKFKIHGGIMAGKYGRRNKDPLPLVLPLAYMEYNSSFLGMNLFVLPPAQGWNDYMVLFAQFKVGF